MKREVVPARLRFRYVALIRVVICFSAIAGIYHGAVWIDAHASSRNVRHVDVGPLDAVALPVDEMHAIYASATGGIKNWSFNGASGVLYNRDDITTGSDLHVNGRLFVHGVEVDPSRCAVNPATATRSAGAHVLSNYGFRVSE